MAAFFHRAGNLLALALLVLTLAACGSASTATSTAVSTSPTAPPTTAATTIAPTTAVATTVASATASATTAIPTTAVSTPTVVVGEVQVVTLKEFHSAILNNDRRVDIFLPPDYNASTARYKTLYMNDGADTYTYNLNKLLGQLYASNQLEKIIVVAIFNTPSRLSEYGVAGKPDSKGRGDRADLYSRFILEEMLPYVKKNYRTLDGPANTAFMGSSLGGLMAFDLVWQHPDVFGKVGVFSGSFWWRSEDGSPTAQQNSRIMHQIVKDSPKRDGLKMWF